MYNKDPDKAGTARMFLSKMIENETTNVYSLEVSMYGYKPDRKSDKIIAYTEENCECWLFSLTFDGVDNSSTVTFFHSQTSSKAAVSAGRCGTTTKSRDTSRAVKY